jgi:hypothetical protein
MNVNMKDGNQQKEDGHAPMQMKITKFGERGKAQSRAK